MVSGYVHWHKAWVAYEPAFEPATSLVSLTATATSSEADS